MLACLRARSVQLRYCYENGHFRCGRSEKRFRPMVALASLLLLEGEFFVLFLFFTFYIQNCFICRFSNSTVPTEAGIQRGLDIGRVQSCALHLPKY
jgi:hypothetical protein